MKEASVEALKVLAATLTIITLLAVTAWVPIASAEQEAMEVYPCSTCHTAIKVDLNVNVSEFHNIDLTKGAHRGLTCANCHSLANGMMTLRNGVPIAIPGIHNKSALMNINTLCATCHVREFELYQVGAHGNSTYECPGGETILVRGYKGVGYRLHLCDDYHNLKTVPAQPCIACHNPHEPTYYAIGILPPPSDRVPPPPQEDITYGGIGVVVAGLSLIAAAHVLHKRSGGG